MWNYFSSPEPTSPQQTLAIYTDRNIIGKHRYAFCFDLHSENAWDFMLYTSYLTWFSCDIGRLLFGFTQRLSDRNCSCVERESTRLRGLWELRMREWLPPFVCTYPQQRDVVTVHKVKWIVCGMNNLGSVVCSGYSGSTTLRWNHWRGTSFNPLKPSGNYMSNLL
jgi:hypothetical protein